MSRRTSRPVKFRPRFEMLEAREVPSAVTVLANDTVRILNQQVFGLNLNNYDGLLSQQAYSTTDTRPDPASVQLLQSAGVQMTRFSHGGGTDSWHFDVEKSLGSTAGAGVLANVTAAIGAQSMVCVNYGTGTPQEAAAYLAYLNGSPTNETPLGMVGGKNWQTAGFWASLRGQNKLPVNDGFNHLRLGRAAPFNFRYFEVGNEAYFGLWQGGNPKAPAAYAAFTKQFADLAALIDPSAKIGVGVGNPIEYDNLWNKPVLDALKAAGFVPGFLSDHFYVYDGKNETPLTDVQLLTQSVSDPNSKMPIHANSPRNWAGRAAAYRSLLNNVYGPAAANVELLVGEFNIDADGSTKQTVALTSGLFMADAIGSLLQTDYNGAMIWNFRNAYLPAFHPNPVGISGWRTGTENGIVGSGDVERRPEAGLNVPFPAYFGLMLAAKLGRSGDSVVRASTDTANVSAYAVRRAADGSLSLLLINKSPTVADTATVSIAGFLPAAGANQWRYGTAEDDAQRLSADGAAALTFTTPTFDVTNLANGGMIQVSLPAYSMTIVTLLPSSPVPPPPVSPPPVSPPPVSPPPVSPPPVSPPPVSPLLVGFRQFAVGSGVGPAPTVQLRNADGSVRLEIPAFPGGPPVEVRVTAADFNGDGVADLIVGTGPGRPNLVRILDGATGTETFATQPFEARFTGGVFVAAGDLDGDGIPELVVTPDRGGGPRVRVFRGSDFSELADIFGIDDPNFRGGVRATVADLSGDGRGDLLVAAGFGGGPRVAGFDGRTVVAGVQPAKLFNDIFAFEERLRNGAYVTAGDLDEDGFADLVAGAGPGGSPRLTVFNGKDLFAGRVPAVLTNFFAGNANNRGGVRVAVKDLDGDGRADLVVGDAEGAGSGVTGYLGKDLGLGGGPAAFEFDAFPGSAGGVYVG